MNGIYLAAYKAYHKRRNIKYQGINNKRDIGGDMLDVPLDTFDYIIATPPCNYYSRANYRRETSAYSQKTKHLLPGIIDKLCKQNKPFIIENVRNDKLYKKLKLYEKPCFIYKIGRHTYWTNIMLIPNIKQKTCNIENLPRTKRQGTEEVHEIIEIFLDIIGA